jgi:acetyl-CoA acetyltransferase
MKKTNRHQKITEGQITDMMSHMITRFLITAGAEELQKTHGWTQEDSAAWALATLARGQAAINKAMGHDA